ncbi:MAG: hypothetical protein UV71_C0014G0013 [Microgenomates group bacterium GW2011_GWC1_43_13]|uniref:Uncharacterized protein n=3 Tax=Candidatus Woeseibacteriota TaxID=1752722 RepID=A0A837IDD6_9BACT|nr:MAG: hypothetical protein UV71_C0014G0013 [Microgenomates group bacterium GW2011_GWC1_43_13]KKT33070.1 MAG: hypothetical protein UW20_C0005G0002 [Candidatus Woesebacteria bacterium GW2011_GWB1_44_11]KKT54732.1 MAG: hypothetical protein UW47_C0003G0001 [Candidatus Woesebacteria bacterium GW2011_GWA1_44_23]OGM81509.1 MAG: hypothetical protein A2394_00925 [Candidatus Woesebacteria bacterium RIFOXYB1_FULL_42_36]OGM88160.1 MAG: hypothetical protein A2573_01990 [Candidatus Woesebacteria bacterium 
MSKRRRFIVTSILLSLGFIAIQFLTDQNRFWSIGALGILTMVLFYWSLMESLGRKMTLLTLVLPTIFTLGVGVFWFLLPTNVFARIPIVMFYAIGIYVLCLTANIYSVASVRTIALLRAARGVGFVLSLLTSFLVFDAILSIKTEIYYLLPFIFVVSFLLYLQGYWTVLLETKLSKDLVTITATSSLLTMEIAAVLYFWPVTVVTGSLFLTVTFYMLLGLGQAKLDGRLFSSTVREHVIVGVLVFVAMFFATHWGG